HSLVELFFPPFTLQLLPPDSTARRALPIEAWPSRLPA
ncbi:hypothetical protein JMJ77_0010855, partial [Colletotrichum scovillei]